MADQDALLEANQAFYRAFEKKSLEAMEAVWSKGITCLCIHPGHDALKGWPEIRQSWAQIFKNTSYIEIDTTIVKVESSGDLGYIVLIEHVLQISSGRRLDAQSMATNLFKRMGDQWYLIHHHGSLVV